MLPQIHPTDPSPHSTHTDRFPIDPSTVSIHPSFHYIQTIYLHFNIILLHANTLYRNPLHSRFALVFCEDASAMDRCSCFDQTLMLYTDVCDLYRSICFIHSCLLYTAIT